MLQRYDISMDFDTNRLSIKEFAVLERVSRKRDNFSSDHGKFSLIQNISYDGDTIRTAMDKGKESLVSAIRSNDFFPIRSCADILVERIIELFNSHSTSCSEVIIDDLDQLSINDG